MWSITRTRGTFLEGLGKRTVSRRMAESYMNSCSIWRRGPQFQIKVPVETSSGQGSIRSFRDWGRWALCPDLDFTFTVCICDSILFKDKCAELQSLKICPWTPGFSWARVIKLCRDRRQIQPQQEKETKSFQPQPHQRVSTALLRGNGDNGAQGRTEWEEKKVSPAATLLEGDFTRKVTSVWIELHDYLC